MAASDASAIVVHPSTECPCATAIYPVDIVRHWYEFQDLLFTRNCSWARLKVAQCALNLPALRAELRAWPVSSFVTSARGVLRLVSRPFVTGGAGRALLRCWTEQVSEAVVVHAEGEIDLTTASNLADAIAAVSEHSGGIIVDLSRLDYLDGSGIRVLEHAAQTCGERFVVVGSKPTIHKLFDILQLTDALPVVPTMEAAQERLRRS